MRAICAAHHALVLTCSTWVVGCTAGPQPQQDVEQGRTDLLHFSSQPLRSHTHIFGNVTVSGPSPPSSPSPHRASAHSIAGGSERVQHSRWSSCPELSLGSPARGRALQCALFVLSSRTYCMTVTVLPFCQRVGETRGVVELHRH